MRYEVLATARQSSTATLPHPLHPRHPAPQFRRPHDLDVRDEEWTPSYAATASRMDFILVAESIDVEVKMTRKSLTQRGILRESIDGRQGALSAASGVANAHLLYLRPRPAAPQPRRH